MTKAREMRVAHDSSDAKYFTMTPRLVWALCRDPYDLSFWQSVKDIAGEHGECYLSTPQMAALAMMSEGKVSACRAYLISVGLLAGEMRRDPGHQQPVWHLSIPDIWKKNVEWAEAHPTIAEKIEYKQQQRRDAATEQSLHQVKAGEEPSPGEEGGSPHEEGTTPGEEGTAPHETKNNQEEYPEEQPKEKPPRGARAAAADNTLEISPKHVGAVVKSFATKVGYALPNPGAESKAARWMLENRYTPAQIFGCYDYLKTESWRTSKVGLATVMSEIGEWVKKGQPKTAAPDGKSPGNGHRNGSSDLKPAMPGQPPAARPILGFFPTKG